MDEAVNLYTRGLSHNQIIETLEQDFALVPNEACTIAIKAHDSIFRLTAKEV